MSSIVRFAGRRFLYAGLTSTPVRHVLMETLDTYELVTARADMVTIETPDERLAAMRERAGTHAPSTLRASRVPVADRDDEDWARADLATERSD